MKGRQDEASGAVIGVRGDGLVGQRLVANRQSEVRVRRIGRAIYADTRRHHGSKDDLVSPDVSGGWRQGVVAGHGMEPPAHREIDVAGSTGYGAPLLRPGNPPSSVRDPHAGDGRGGTGTLVQAGKLVLTQCLGNGRCSTSTLVTVDPVEGGTRCAPTNSGIALARSDPRSDDA
jgi:hypothetical protein